MTRERASPCEFCDIAHGDGEIGSTNPFVEREFDVALGTDDFVAFPDAAPLGPGHALVVPREHVLSFARLDPGRRRRARRLVDTVVERLPAPADHAAYVFEHGSDEGDETAGCGITHAHLHVLYLPTGMLDGEHDLAHFEAYSDLSAALAALGREDYYLFGRHRGTVRATVVQEVSELKCSMFLRKWVAGRLDRPELADYGRYLTRGRDDMIEEVTRTHELLSQVAPPQ